jgi:hypothetical protein
VLLLARPCRAVAASPCAASHRHIMPCNVSQAIYPVVQRRTVVKKAGGRRMRHTNGLPASVVECRPAPKHKANPAVGKKTLSIPNCAIITRPMLPSQ